MRLVESLADTTKELATVTKELVNNVSNLIAGVTSVEHKIQLFEAGFANIDERVKNVDTLLGKLINFTLDNVEKLDSRMERLEARLDDYISSQR